MAQRKTSAPKSGNAKGGNRHGVGCLVWLGLILVILLLFFLNRAEIERVIANSRFRDALNENTLDNSKKTKPSDEPKPDEVITAKPETEKPAPKVAPDSVIVPTKPEAPPAEPPSERKPAPDPLPEIKSTSDKKPEAKPVAKPASKPEDTQPEPAKVRKSTLYFVRLDDDGSIVRMEVKRSIKEAETPLKDALVTLIRGPNEAELKKGLISLIPVGTRLISVAVRGTTAMVNLSEEFMFNTLGIEGYSGQLKQVVWTCTEFPTVKDVQILIDGKQVNYLGGEGVYIGRPLSRNSF